MRSTFDDIIIRGISTVMPEHVINNIDYAPVFGEKEVKKQIKVTGMEERHTIVGNQDVVDLSLHAIDAVMKHTGWEPEDINVVVYVSAYHGSPSRRDMCVPTAKLLMDAIGIDSSRCLAFDMNLGCSSYVNGMFAISSVLADMPEGGRGLLVVSDATSYSGEEDDKTVSMLAGDCGTATAVERLVDTDFRAKTDKGQWNYGHMDFLQYMDGGRYEFITRLDPEHNLEMDGMAVFNFAITDVVDAIGEFFDFFGYDKDGIDACILHQAQKFIVDKVASFATLPKERVLVSYDRHGNTGGPSLPTTLCVNRNRYIGQEMIKTFFAGFGSGLSWGFFTAMIRSEDVLEPIYTDSLYEGVPSADHENQNDISHTIIETVADYSFHEAENYISNRKWKREDIRFLFLITHTEDLLIPSTASVVHKRLGLSHDCLIWDIDIVSDEDDVADNIVAAMKDQITGGGKGMLVYADPNRKNTEGTTTLIGYE